jgi:hypothetical protein
MVKITLEGALAARLAGAGEPVELCDVAGRTLGYFTPADERPSSACEPQVDQAELDRRQRAGGGRELAQILADLERPQ